MSAQSSSAFGRFLIKVFFGNNEEAHKQSASGLLMLVETTDKNTLLLWA